MRGCAPRTIALRMPAARGGEPGGSSGSVRGEHTELGPPQQTGARQSVHLTVSSSHLHPGSHRKKHSQPPLNHRG